jgi:hypothetical protein
VKKGIQFQYITRGYPIFPAAFVREAVCFPSCVMSSFVEDMLVVDEYVYVWVFYSDPLLFLYVFVPIT